METGPVRATIVDMAAFQVDSEVELPCRVLLPRPGAEVDAVCRFAETVRRAHD